MEAKSTTYFYSLIVPTFGRPDEVTEFLESLRHQNFKDFEVIIADGTPGDTLRRYLKPYDDGTYPLHIIYEEYLPVSAARNEGAKAAKGDYFIFLDSDCIIPPDYLNKVDNRLRHSRLDAFGGPDKAHENFTPLQKAISYSMTSIFTTGGIRGQKKHVGQFHPRGFNMGIRREAFEAVGGYSDFRCGEDIELSIRIIKAGYKVGLIPEAHVYHKRRTSLTQFFKQVFRFGAARMNIYKRHREELKLTHLFPTAFLLFTFFTLIGLISGLKIFYICFALLLIYALLIALFASVQTKSMFVGSYSILTSFTMLFGYGYGFIANAWAYYARGMKNGLKL